MLRTVGKRGENIPDDVREVQIALNRVASRLRIMPLKVDGRCGNKTIDAISRFQLNQGIANSSGLIERDGRISKALGLLPSGTAPEGSALLSGGTWWRENQARWPNEHRISELSEPFRSNVTRFVAALEQAGAKVTITTTTRSIIRAQLMRYSYDIAQGKLVPDAVPAIQGVAINWNHGDLTKSRAAAKEMATLFEIKKQPSMTSNHFKGAAVDMTIEWSGTLTILRIDHSLAAINSAPRNGTNSDLQKVGATYGLYHKMPDDRPHWSITGH